MPSSDVFFALADPNRRFLLETLAARGEATATELAAELPVTRQAVAKHLAILEEANLVAVTWQGREKLHFINPVPINEIAERWISKFEQPRLRALSKLKRTLEGEDHG